jgi:hypothetical protein
MRRERSTRIRRIAAIPCLMLAPLAWVHGCSAWQGQPVTTLAGVSRFAGSFLPLAILIFAGVGLWAPLPKKSQ